MTARVLVTGTAGFIGFHLARLLLDEGFAVHGYDGLTPYYDTGLKRARHAILHQHPAFSATEAMLEEEGRLLAVAERFAPDVIVHLAAQAGVRHSLEAPRAYLASNVAGSFELLEAARAVGVRHLLIASTSSVYGGNPRLPFRETDRTDWPLSIYAATKKAAEDMAHSHAHLWGLPTTMLRFFTVYGPWGRPDLALYRFVEAILEGRPIDLYNHGDMRRDFTYVADLVRAIRLLMDAVPRRPEGGTVPEGDSLSPVAPYRVVNIGASRPVRLLDFVTAIEAALGRPARRNLMPMQKGDAPATWADASLLERLTGYCPDTPLEEGVRQFVSWYRDWTGR
jgi:UDP-glucuronate 4-epimerase